MRSQILELKLKTAVGAGKRLRVYLLFSGDLF